MNIKDFLPFNAVNGEGFKELFGLFVPNFKIPSRNTVRSRIVQLYDQKRSELYILLDKLGSVFVITHT